MQLLIPDLFWRMFESTGSIRAYLAYRRFAPLGRVLRLTISLN